MIGIDIVEVDRIQKAIERWGSAFLDRVFTAVEQDYCNQFRFRYERFAGRFAAKEAVAKVFRTGPVNFWLDVEILPTDGAPIVRFSDRVSGIVGRRNVVVSIAHERHYAVATAMCHVLPN